LAQDPSQPSTLSYLIGIWYATPSNALAAGVGSIRLAASRYFNTRPAAFGQKADFDSLPLVVAGDLRVTQAQETCCIVAQDIAFLFVVQDWSFLDHTNAARVRFGPDHMICINQHTVGPAETHIVIFLRRG
jgi:hypothetical protein